MSDDTASFVATVWPVARTVAGRVTAHWRARGLPVEYNDVLSGAAWGAWKAAQAYQPDRSAPTTWAWYYCTRYAEMSANAAAGLTVRGNGLHHTEPLDDQLLDRHAPTAERIVTGVAVRRAVATLPDPERTVVFLTYWLRLGPTDIGRRLGRSKAGIRVILSRAHDTLRTALNDPITPTLE